MINKQIFYAFSKVNSKFKYHEFQISFIPLFELNILLKISFKRYLGNLNLLNCDLFAILSIYIIHTTKEDHAGLYLSLNILGIDFEYSFKDVRHYDYTNDKFIEL